MAKHKWTKKDCLLVITEFVKRYKTEDYKNTEKDVVMQIGTSASSVKMTCKNFVPLLINQLEGFGSNISKTQGEALMNYLENYNDVNPKKLIYIFEN
ncbi:hypothetical protein [Winogradskyella aquimaris]|uniref:Uncharacterized protein n=1 Tax=Winogradskyella aquimaris TaxID=864074 RepID=A0ABU5EPD5_9FLAO|nr:hypothetical protein [Winogradskyella aquimaris]MDY2588207.1 hypothetical protein [Winogradskyella aquimaris]